MRIHQDRRLISLLAALYLLCPSVQIYANPSDENSLTLTLKSLHFDVPAERALESELIRTSLSIEEEEEASQRSIELSGLSDRQMHLLSEYLNTSEIPALDREQCLALISAADYLKMPTLLKELSFRFLSKYSYGPQHHPAEANDLRQEVKGLCEDSQIIETAAYSYICDLLNPTIHSSQICELVDQSQSVKRFLIASLSKQRRMQMTVFVKGKPPILAFMTVFLARISFDLYGNWQIMDRISKNLSRSIGQSLTGRSQIPDSYWNASFDEAWNASIYELRVSFGQTKPWIEHWERASKNAIVESRKAANETIANACMRQAMISCKCIKKNSHLPQAISQIESLILEHSTFFENCDGAISKELYSQFLQTNSEAEKNLFTVLETYRDTNQELEPATLGRVIATLSEIMTLIHAIRIDNEYMDAVYGCYLKKLARNSPEFEKSLMDPAAFVGLFFRQPSNQCHNENPYTRTLASDLYHLSKFINESRAS